MSSEHKTRAERIIELRAEAESLLIDLTLHAHDSIKAGSARHRMRLAFAEALALPPDPSRGSEMRVITQAQANDLQGVIAAIDRLLAAAPKPEPAEPAQDDDYRSLDHACEILRGCVAPYSGEQAYAVAKALKQWRDKWAAAVDCIHPDERQTIADLRAKLAIATRECDALKSEGDEFLAERDGAWRERDALRAKLEAAEASLVARHGGEPLALLAELDEARAKLAAAEARIVESDGLWGWIAENIGDVDFHVLVPAGIFSSQPWVATGSTLRRALERARRELGAAMGGT